MAKNLFISVVVFISFFITGHFIIEINKRETIQTEKQRATKIAANSAYTIEHELSNSLSATKALGAIIQQYGYIKDFDSLAYRMMNLYSGINSLQLAPDGVVTEIYPPKGNENAKGNLLDDSLRKTECLLAISTKQLTLAGPYELKQGGIGIIGRYPVFLDKNSEKDIFWGFTIVLIKLDDLLDRSLFGQVDSSGYDYQLSKVHPDSMKSYVFSSNSKRTDWSSAVSFSFNVPNNIWTLTITPKDNWYDSDIDFLFHIIVVVISLMMSVLSYLLSKQNASIKQNADNLKILNNSKDKLFSIIAHDLINPIGSFQQITELLKDSSEDFSKEEREEFISVMNTSAKEIYSLLENLLLWSRSQRGLITFQPKELNVKEIITDILKLLLIIAKNKSIELENNIRDDFVIFADLNMIKTIIRNLLSNAIKFTQQSGKVQIGIISDESEKFLTIYIKDTGVGIEQKVIDKLFNVDNHYTTIGTNQEKGTGLGLILCKEFSEKNNGKIWVESEIGKGSTFFISLPRVKKVN